MSSRQGRSTTTSSPTSPTDAEQCVGGTARRGIGTCSRYRDARRWRGGLGGSTAAADDPVRNPPCGASRHRLQSRAGSDTRAPHPGEDRRSPTGRTGPRQRRDLPAGAVPPAVAGLWHMRGVVADARPHAPGRTGTRRGGTVNPVYRSQGAGAIPDKARKTSTSSSRRHAGGWRVPFLGHFRLPPRDDDVDVFPALSGSITGRSVIRSARTRPPAGGTRATTRRSPSAPAFRLRCPFAPPRPTPACRTDARKDCYRQLHLPVVCAAPVGPACARRSAASAAPGA
jgi:hypothetical protein